MIQNQKELGMDKLRFTTTNGTRKSTITSKGNGNFFAVKSYFHLDYQN